MEYAYKFRSVCLLVLSLKQADPKQSKPYGSIQCIRKVRPINPQTTAQSTAQTFETSKTHLPHKARISLISSLRK